MDIKVELVKPLSQIFKKGDDVFYSVISDHSDHIHQGIIKTPSRNKLFLSLIDYIKTKGPRDFDYHLPIEFTTNQTPKTWTEKLI